MGLDMTENISAAPTAAEGARFDWYAATVYDDEDTLVQACEADIGGVARRMGHGMHGYERGYDIVGLDPKTGELDAVCARVLAGGFNGMPHVFASGDDTMLLVSSVRGRWPDRHKVTRLDSALDYDAPGAFNRLLELVWAKAKQRTLRVDQKGDWMRQDSPAGRTFYAGSFKSPAMVRLYEKGKQVRGQLTDAASAERVSPDWCRLELQLRPMRGAKLTAASAGPLEVWGYSRWAGELLRDVEGVMPERVNMNPERESNDERAFAFLCRQYGAVLERMAGASSWAELGEQIGARVLLERSGNDLL